MIVWRTVYDSKEMSMTLIALEEHFIPPDLIDQVWSSRKTPEALRAAMVDLEGQRLRAMDAAGIDIQVLSIATPAAQEVPADASVSLAKALNDRAQAAVAAHPDRFRALATLPTPNPSAAADEARRAVSELGFCGVMINNHTAGKFLDAPEFEPMLAAIEELGVPIYLHPTYPPPAVAEIYFSGLDAPTADALATAAWGWHAETGLHVLRMAANGVFERHPGLQVVVGHMGENLPFSLMRADSMLSQRRPDARSVADIVREHVHITICGYPTVPPLLCALSVFGADRILFSVDYPFADCEEHARFLATAPVSPADREKIAHRNAEQLFKL
jgi:predicted TIM-barrel fold metal-dependent hydrolase